MAPVRGNASERRSLGRVGKDQRLEPKPMGIVAVLLIEQRRAIEHVGQFVEHHRSGYVVVVVDLEVLRDAEVVDHGAGAPSAPHRDVFAVDHVGPRMRERVMVLCREPDRQA